MFSCKRYFIIGMCAILFGSVLVFDLSAENPFLKKRAVKSKKKAALNRSSQKKRSGGINRGREDAP